MDGGRWHFDDAPTGTTIRHSGRRTIGADEHPWLAWITNNASDLHGNVDRAASSEFGQTVVLGALTVAIVVGLAEPAEWPPDQASSRRSTGWSSIALSRPVLAGDTIQAESEILAAEAFVDGGGGMVSRRIVGRNQRGDEVVSLVEDRAVPARRS